MASLNCLNDDCLMEIFQYLDTPMNHLCVSKVCKRWRFLIEDTCLKAKKDLLFSDNLVNFPKEIMAFRDFNQILKLYGSSVEKISFHLSYLRKESKLCSVHFKNSRHSYNLFIPSFSKIIDLFVNRLFFLKTIDLSLSEVDDNLFTSIEFLLSKMERLENLKFNNNFNYNIKLPTSLRSLSFIHVMSYHVSKFDMISFIEKATQLEELRIEYTGPENDLITDELLEALSKWATKLKILLLHCTTQVTFANFGKLKSLLDLEELRLLGFRFPGKDLLAVASSCKKIRKLKLPCYFKKEEEIISSVKSSLPKLEELKFYLY